MASKYAKEREKLGLSKVGSASSVSTKSDSGKSKYALERAALSDPSLNSAAENQQYSNLMQSSRLMEIDNLERERKANDDMKSIGMDWTSQVKRGTSAPLAKGNPLSLGLGPISQEKYNSQMDLMNRNGTIGPADPKSFALDDVVLAFQKNDDAAKKRLADSRFNELPQEVQTQWRNMALERSSELSRLNSDSRIATDLRKFADATKPIADIGMTLYTPGAGLGVLQGATRGAEALVAKAAPRLAGSALGRIGQASASEALVGAPTAVGQTLTQNPEASGRELLESAALGAGGGALLGGLGKTFGEGIRGLRGSSKTIGDTTRSMASQEARTAINSVDVARKASPDLSVQRATITSNEPVVLDNTSQTKARGNLSTQLESERFSPELQTEINKRDNTYTTRTHAGALEEANANIANLSEAEVRFLANKEVTDTHVATGYRLMQELDRMGEYERAANVSSKLMEDLTRAGQSASAARIIQRLSPEGQLMHLQRVAKESGKEVSVADSQVYKRLAKDVQEGSLSGKETSDFMKTLQKLKNGEVATDDEMKQARSILEDAQRFVKSGKKPRVITPELNNVRTRDKVLAYFEQQALEARKAWDAKRNIGFSQRLSEPDVVLLAKMAAHKVAKGVVNFADFTEYLVKDFGEIAKPYAQEVYDRSRSLVRATSKGISEGKLKEATEAFERLSKGKSDAEKVAEKFLKDNPVKARDIEKLDALVKDLNDLKGAKAVDAEIQMQKIINNYTKSSLVDKLNTLRYISMLFNSGTQSVNALSGPIMATTGYVADIFGTMADIALSNILKRPRTTTLYKSNPLTFLAHYFKNLKTGAKAGWHGAEPAGIQSQSDIRGLTFKSNYNPANWLERGLGSVSKGTDYATYKTVFDSEIRKQAFLNAKNKGLKGTDRKAFIEQFVANPTDEALEIADRIGRNTTFQRQDSLGGQLANYLHGAPKNFPKVEKFAKPVISVVTPFVRTPINIASTAVTMTPAGIIKGMLQLVKSGTDPILQREAIRTLGLSITGTAGIGVLGYALSDLGIITGANDSGDRNVDAVREQAGRGKYRFNTSALQRYITALFSGEGPKAAREAAKYQEGDKQFDYNKLQPLAFPLAAGASFQENEKKGIGQALSASGKDAIGSLLGMSSLTGVQNILQKPYQGTEGDRSLNIVSNVVESYLKSFSPSLLAQEARRQDTTQRKTAYGEGIKKDVGQYFQSRFPGQSQKLLPNLTALGDEKKYAEGVSGQYLNPFRSEKANFNKAAVIVSDLIDRTGDMSLAPKAPDKKVSGKNAKGEHVEITIPPNRYVKYQEEIGKEVTRQIIALGSMSDADKADRIKDIYSKVKEKHRNIVKRELGIRVK